nr:hypothetical protein [uncultured Halomonas sp.]
MLAADVTAGPDWLPEELAADVVAEVEVLPVAAPLCERAAALSLETGVAPGTEVEVADLSSASLLVDGLAAVSLPGALPLALLPDPRRAECRLPASSLP